MVLHLTHAHTTDWSRYSISHIQLHTWQWTVSSNIDSSRAPPPEVQSHDLCGLVDSHIHHQIDDKWL